MSRKKHPIQEILDLGGIISGEEFDEMLRDKKVQDEVDERLAVIFGVEPRHERLYET